MKNHYLRNWLLFVAAVLCLVSGGSTSCSAAKLELFARTKDATANSVWVFEAILTENGKQVPIPADNIEAYKGQLNAIVGVRGSVMLKIGDYSVPMYRTLGDGLYHYVAVVSAGLNMSNYKQQPFGRVEWDDEEIPRTDASIYLPPYDMDHNNLIWAPYPGVTQVDADGRPTNWQDCVPMWYMPSLTPEIHSATVRNATAICVLLPEAAEPGDPDADPPVPDKVEDPVKLEASVEVKVHDSRSLSSYSTYGNDTQRQVNSESALDYGGSLRDCDSLSTIPAVNWPDGTDVDPLKVEPFHEANPMNPDDGSGSNQFVFRVNYHNEDKLPPLLWFAGGYGYGREVHYTALKGTVLYLDLAGYGDYKAYAMYLEDGTKPVELSVQQGGGHTYAVKFAPYDVWGVPLGTGGPDDLIYNPVVSDWAYNSLPIGTYHYFFACSDDELMWPELSSGRYYSSSLGNGDFVLGCQPDDPSVNWGNNDPSVTKSEWGLDYQGYYDYLQYNYDGTDWDYYRNWPGYNDNNALDPMLSRSVSNYEFGGTARGISSSDGVKNDEIDFLPDSYYHSYNYTQWPTDRFKGKKLEFVSGEAAGTQYTILSQTAYSMVLDAVDLEADGVASDDEFIIVGTCEIARDAHRRYSSAPGSEFDDTIFVDRPIRSPGYFDDSATQRYRQYCSEHPVVTCSLTVDSTDIDGVSLDDVSKYGGGRFYGTLWPYKRAVNPMLPGSVRMDGTSRRAEFSGGVAGQKYEFRIKFKQKDGSAPNYIKLRVNDASSYSKIDATGDLLPASRYEYKEYTMQADPGQSDYAGAGVWYRYSLVLTPGPHTYYFEAADDSSRAVWPRRPDRASSGWLFQDWWVPTLSTMEEYGTANYDNNDFVPGPYVNSKPILSKPAAGYVTPTSGKMGDVYRFSVKYTDPDGQRPLSTYVFIQTSEGTVRRCQMLPETALDPTKDNRAVYKAGVNYYYLLSTAQDTTVQTGARRFYFEFTDDWGRQIDDSDTIQGETVRLTDDGKQWKEGPTISGPIAPLLSEGKTESADGTANSATLWKFGVKYTDANNETPKVMNVYIGLLQPDGETIIWDSGNEMIPTDPSDKVYTDGANYYYQTRLPGQEDADDTAKTYYYAFVAHDGTMWAEYDSVTSPSAAVVRNALVGTGDGIQTGFTIVPPIPGSPLVGPLQADLPVNPNDLADAQIIIGGTKQINSSIWNIVGGQFNSVNDQMSGWEAAPRFSVMKGAATTLNGSPSGEYVVPERTSRIASIQGVYATRANLMADIDNLYQPNMAEPATMPGTADVADASGLTIIPESPDFIGSVLEVTGENATGDVIPIVSAGDIKNGVIVISDPDEALLELDGTPKYVNVYIKYLKSAYVMTTKGTASLKDQSGLTLLPADDSGNAWPTEELWRMAKVLQVIGDKVDSDGLLVQADAVIASAGDVNGKNIIPITDPAEKLFNMGLDSNTNQIKAIPIYKNIRIKYLRSGYVLGNKLIWLSQTLPDEFKGKTVFIKYNDICFTHQQVGFATDATTLIPGGYGVTHYRPNQGNTTTCKGNYGDSVDPASGIIGVWAEYERMQLNYFNTYRGGRYPDNDFKTNALKLSTEVPSGTGELWARFYQKGAYNIDRSNGTVEFATAIDNGVAVWSNYIFGTGMKDKNGQDVTIGANTPPTLSMGRLDKDMGQRADSFVFTVVYKDTDGPNGQTPEYVKVYVDDVAYDMATAGNGSTPPYRQGATFTYTLSGLSGGSHRYRFEASDGAALAVFDYYESIQNKNGETRPTSGANLIRDIDGPWVNDVPLLTQGMAQPNPDPGKIGTSQTIDYTVLYTDLDNDIPFEFDTVLGDVTGANIAGTPRVWIDADPIDVSYTGKVVGFVADMLEPNKSRTMLIKALDDTEPNWTPDQFKGRLLQITNGSLEAQVFLIYANTANTLTISTNDLHTDGFSATPGSETAFQINGIKMTKLNAEEQDFTKGIKYKITVPKLAVGDHRFHFAARSRLIVPAWLPDQIMTGVVDITGLVITPSAPLHIKSVSGVYTDSICQAVIPSATTGLLNAQSQIAITVPADKLAAGTIVYIKYSMAPYTDPVRDPATGDHTGPSVELQSPVGNKAPTLGGGMTLGGPFGKRADVVSSTRVMLNTVDPITLDVDGNWTKLEADSARYIMGVYLNATLDTNASVNKINYLTVPVGTLSSDYEFNLTAELPAIADGTTMVQIGTPDGDSLLRVNPDAPSVISVVTGVYLNPELTSANYYGSVVGGKIILSQQLPSGTQQVYIKYNRTAGPGLVYIKYLRAKPVAPAKFPYGHPLTLRINYSDPDGDVPTMHDGVVGYLNLIMGNPESTTAMVPVEPVNGNYTIPRPFAWAFMAAPTGINKFHFVASDGYDLPDPLTTHAVRYPILEADDSSFDVNSVPVISLGTVTPTDWHPTTDFNFKVHYVDADGLGTTPVVKVRLYNSAAQVEYVYTMTTTGTDFVAGVDYTLAMPSAGVPMLTPGTYTVTFEAHDGTQFGAHSTLGQSIYVRPSNSSPIIVSTSVSPGFGKTSTGFIYRAYFRDPDADPPILPVGMFDGAKHVAALMLVVDKGTAAEQRYLMNKAATAPAIPNYAIAGGVAFETAGIQINSNGQAVHTYEVRASDGELAAVSVIVNNAPIANRAPSIVSHSVTPNIGGLNAKFVYRANFRDPDGDAPVKFLNGTKYEGLLLIIDKGTVRETKVIMTKAAGEPANPDYTLAGGIAFETSPGVTINQSSDAVHTYEIESSDGLLNAPVVGATDMPLRNRGPVILSHSVDPTYGTVNTAFVYRAKYRDPDNDPPIATLAGQQSEGLLLTIDKGLPTEKVVVMTRAASEPANPDFTSANGVAYETAPGIQIKLGGAAIHTYQIEATDGLRIATKVEVNDAPGNRRPVIVSHGLTPIAGGMSIKFVYRAYFMDPDGEAPIVNKDLYDAQQHKNAMFLIIDKGTARQKKVLMSKAASEPANPDYTAAVGVAYDNYPGINIDQSSTEIHTYEIEAGDGLLDAVTAKGTDAPIRNRAPVIVSHSVAPGAGKVSTKFVYQARYMDPDNDPPVATLAGQTLEGLLLVLDKGTTNERTIRLTKSATAGATPDYTAAGGVLFETAPGITMNQFGSIIHTYEIQASDGLLSGVTAKATNVPVHLVPRFDSIRAVSANAANPDTASGLTSASVGENILVVGLIKFPKNTVYAMPASGAQLSIKVTRPDGNTILLGGYVTIQPASTDPIYWIGKIKVSEYTKDADPALVTGLNLTLSDSGDWKFGAARLSDPVWDAVETDTVMDGRNDGYKLTVGGPMRVMAVSDTASPAISAPIVDMITPAMVIADGDVGRIFGYDWAAKMQIVRWDPTTKNYFRYGTGNFPQLNPGESVWIKPLISYSPETAVQASIDSGLLTAPSGIQLLGNRQYRILHSFSKAYPTQRNITTGLTELAPCVVPLYDGWNQFGNIFINWKKDTSGKPLSPRQDVGIPFSELRVRYLNQELSIADASVAGWIRDYAYRFDAATRKYVLVNASEPGAERALKSWSGFWIRAFVDCDLVINPNTTYNGSVIPPTSVNSLAGVSRKFDTPPAMPAAE